MKNSLLRIRCSWFSNYIEQRVKLDNQAMRFIPKGFNTRAKSIYGFLDRIDTFCYTFFGERFRSSLHWLFIRAYYIFSIISPFLQSRGSSIFNWRNHRQKAFPLWYWWFLHFLFLLLQDTLILFRLLEIYLLGCNSNPCIPLSIVIGVILICSIPSFIFLELRILFLKININFFLGIRMMV